MRLMCISCGTTISKSALTDPYLCRECERILEGAGREEMFVYLDRNF